MKYCTSTKWHWPDGVPNEQEFVEQLAEILPLADWERAYWYKIDDNHSGSFTLYPDKEAYLRYMAELNEFRGKATSDGITMVDICLLYTSPSPRDRTRSRMPSSA